MAITKPVSLYRVWKGVFVAAIFVVVYQICSEYIETSNIRDRRSSFMSSHVEALRRAFIYNEEVPTPSTFKPFIEGQPHMLLIISYQRCGSSFFGGLFDRSNISVYFYEPLDGLYDAMYGTAEGWNVPSDIMNWKNGSQRIIPPEEVKAVSKFLENLMTCQYHSIPSEFYLHKFWSQFWRYQRRVDPFVGCMSKAKELHTRGECYKSIEKSCSARFGKNVERQDTCMKSMWNTTSNSPQLNPHPAQFSKYATCLEGHRKRSTHCIDKLMDLCKNSKFRSVKTVRATMDSVEPLLENNPNLRVIHLLRDPRAVVLSRLHFHTSGRSMYAGRDIVKEAKLFCQNLVRDITIRQSLEVKYPGVFKEVLYDDFVLEPMNYTKDIYNFVNLTLEHSLESWVIKNTQDKKNSTLIASKWLSSLSYLEVRQITDGCMDFFKLVPHDWML